MKILTREQIQTKLKFAQKLTETGEDLQEVIARYNNLLSTATDEIQNLKGRFNEIVQEVQGFLGGIHDEQEAHMDKRTDRWRESDAGQAYQGWADAWGKVDPLIKTKSPGV